MRKQLGFFVFCLALAGVGCRNATEPTPAAIQSLAGTWTSLTSGSLPEGCSDVTWNVTNVSGNSASGSFTASCQGIQATGTATATQSGSNINWTLAATATAPGVGTCPVSLSGTLVFEGDNIKVTFAGVTCLGPVSGSETLRRS